MKRKSLIGMVMSAALLFSQTGCTLGIKDAFAAGVYDFVAAAVTETLTAFNPLSLLTTVMSSMAAGA